MRKRFLLFLATFVAPWILEIYYRTLKINSRNFSTFSNLLEKNPGLIIVFWHEYIMLPLYVFRFRNLYGLVSQHLDGEIITRIIRHFGHGAIRGSSTRGGKEAYWMAKRMLESKRLILAITPDGPVGPRRKAKMGAVRLASETGVPILPVSAAASHYRRLKSWDRFMLILPFARCELKIGTPLRVPRNLTSIELTKYNQKLEQILNGLDGE